MSISRQYAAAEIEPPADAPLKAAKPARLAAARKAVAEAEKLATKPRKALAETKRAGETKPRETKPAGIKPRGGRPRRPDGEPWKAEGLSRTAWYRKQKAKA